MSSGVCAAMRASSVASVDGLAATQQLRPRVHVGVVVIAVHQDDRAQLRQLGADLEELGQLLGVVDDRDVGVAVLGDVVALLGRAGRVDADWNAARVDRRDVADQPLRTVEADQRHRFARLEAQRDQALGRQADLRAVLRPRLALPLS